jgi:hypothetical protein
VNNIPRKETKGGEGVLEDERSEILGKLTVSASED